MGAGILLGILGETYLIFWIVTLLAYGVVIKGGKVSRRKNMTNLSILVLVLTAIIEIGQGITNSLIKTIILVGGVIVLLVSNEEWEEREGKWEDYEYKKKAKKGENKRKGEIILKEDKKR